MVLFFTHIPFVVNRTINATPPERLQQPRQFRSVSAEPLAVTSGTPVEKHCCNQWGKARGSHEPIRICCLPGWTLNPAGLNQDGMHFWKYSCESSNVCWWYSQCVLSPSIGGLQCLLNICGDYAVEHEIIFNCNKTIGVLFCPKKYKQPAPSNVFLNGVRV